MRHALALLSIFFLSSLPGLSAEPLATPTATLRPVVVRLSLKAEEKTRKDLAYYLKGELELIEGVTVTEKEGPVDYELDVLQVNEPLGRVAITVSFTRLIRPEEDLSSYKKLLGERWESLGEYLRPFGVTVSRQLLTGRKGKLRELCGSVAESFAKDVLKRLDETEPTPTDGSEKQ